MLQRKSILRKINTKRISRKRVKTREEKIILLDLKEVACPRKT